MKKLNTTILFATLLGLLCSCSNFLEPRSNSEYVPKDANSLNEILLGEGYMHPDDQTNLHVFVDILDDDVQCSKYSANKQNIERYPALQAAFSWDTQMFYRFSEAGYSEPACNIWRGGYSKILGANAVMDYIEQAAGSEQEKNLVKAQAFALRGYYHFYLVNVFALPYNAGKSLSGIPIRTSSKMQNTPLKKNTIEEVYKQVLQDLHQSEKLYSSMPEELQFKRNYRVNLPMVNLLLSRVYLYMEDWENASLYAQKVLNNKTFSLYNLNNINASPYNYLSATSPETIWQYGNTSDVFSFATERWKIGYRQITIFVASPSLIALYDDDDLRKTKYLVNQYNTNNFTAYSKIALQSNSYIDTEYEFARAFRLSEAYLNLAEADIMLAKAGKTERKTAAIQTVNFLRENRYKTGSNFALKGESVDKLIEIIREERRRELCFEGHRWFDLKRYGMPEIKHYWHNDEASTQEFVLHAKDPRYVVPIPYWALELNKYLIEN